MIAVLVLSEEPFKDRHCNETFKSIFGCNNDSMMRVDHCRDIEGFLMNKDQLLESENIL